MIESPAPKSNSKTPSPQVLIVSPTRELALQTAETLTMLCDLLNWKTVCLFGGMPKTEQVRQLNQKDLKVVVGTPGRVLDLLNDGAVSFDKVTYLVLDEADRMLDKGFENDIRQIIAQTPTEGRQTLMFSATWPDSVRGLAATFMKEPVRITVGSDELAANTRVSQSASCSPSSVHCGSAADLLLLLTCPRSDVEVFASSRDKDPRLLSVLRSHTKEYAKGSSKVPLRILVFALYKKEATRLEQTIKRAGFAVAGLHGDMGQRERMSALDGFKTGEVGVLVATGAFLHFSFSRQILAARVAFGRLTYDSTFILMQMLPLEDSTSPTSPSSSTSPSP